MKNLYPDEPTAELERERRLAELEALLQRLAREARSAGADGRRPAPAFGGPWGFDIPLGG